MPPRKMSREEEDFPRMFNFSRWRESGRPVLFVNRINDIYLTDFLLLKKEREKDNFRYLTAHRNRRSGQI